MALTVLTLLELQVLGVLRVRPVQTWLVHLATRLAVNSVWHAETASSRMQIAPVAMIAAQVSTVTAVVARHVELGRSHQQTRDPAKAVHSLATTNTRLAASLYALNVKLELSLTLSDRAARTAATLVMASFLPQAQSASSVLQERHRMTVETNASLAWPDRQVQELSAFYAALELLLRVTRVVVSRAVFRTLRLPSSTVRMALCVASVGQIRSL
jgi:hypothetical protein